jgi:hypothetical protein
VAGRGRAHHETRDGGHRLLLPPKSVRSPPASGCGRPIPRSVCRSATIPARRESRGEARNHCPSGGAAGLVFRWCTGSCCRRAGSAWPR